jgi:hypothetical protein
MRALALAALAATLLMSGCASLEPRPAPLTRSEVIALAKSGASPQAIVGELERTRTVFWLSASDIMQLHAAGVPREVLDYLQRMQIEQVRRDERFDLIWGYPGYYYGGPGRCLGPTPGYYPYRAYRGWYWPCF